MEKEAMSLLDDLKALLRKHEPSIFDETTAFGPKFNRLLLDVRKLLVGLELSEQEGEALITEIRIRMRRPGPSSYACGYNEAGAQKVICEAIAEHQKLPLWCRWETDGVSYKFIKEGAEVWGYISFFEILNVVIDRRIAKAKADKWRDWAGI